MADTRLVTARKVRTSILHHNRQVVRCQVDLLQADHMRVAAQRRQAEQLPAQHQISMSQTLFNKFSKHDYG